MINRRTLLSGIAGTAAAHKLKLTDPALAAMPERSALFDRQFGARGDGTTDNSTAFNRFSVWAKAQSAAGFGVRLELTPHATYNFDHSLCQGCFYNIRKFHLIGNHARLQNTYDRALAGPNAFYERGFPPTNGGVFVRSDGGTNGYLIKTTSPGDQQVTLQTREHVSNFSIGDWVLVGSLDTQYYGYPPNLGQYEYVQVTGINARTGAVSFVNQALRYAHRSDFPDAADALSRGVVPCGKARIWQINRSSDLRSPLTTYTAFGVEHTYENIVTNVAPSSATVTAIFTGLHIKTINWKGLGHVESSLAFGEHHGAQWDQACEVDKNNGLIVWQDCHWRCPAEQAAIFQSASPVNAEIIGGKIEGGLGIGARNLVVRNCEIDRIYNEIAYGMNVATTIDGCRVHSYPDNLLLGSSLLPIDGTNISFTNGTFALLKRGANLGAMNVMPGTQICLPMGQNGLINAWPGELGHGYVTSLSENATHILLATTLPYASIPSWAAGTVRIVRQLDLAIRDSSGAANVRSAADADSLGKREWELLRFTLSGQSAADGSFRNVIGNLVSCGVNVVQPSLAADAQLLLIFPTLYAAASLDPTTTRMVIAINTNTPGARRWTQSEAIQPRSGDSVTVGAAAQPFLPKGLIAVAGGSSSLNWSCVNFRPSDFQPHQLPVIHVELEFDCGTFRKMRPVQ